MQQLNVMLLNCIVYNTILVAQYQLFRQRKFFCNIMQNSGLGRVLGILSPTLCKLDSFALAADNMCNAIGL